MQDTKETPSSSKTQRTPWPMWPFALSIGLFVVVYTWINFEYRKSDNPYEPFQAMQERIEQRVSQNIYDWYSLKPEAVAPSEISNPAAIHVREWESDLESELPEQLVYYLPRRPILFDDVSPIAPESTIAPTRAYHIELNIPGALIERGQFKLQAFYKEGDLFIVPELFVEEAATAADSLDSPRIRVLYAIPTDPIERDSIQARLLLEGRFVDWTITLETDA